LILIRCDDEFNGEWLLKNSLSTQNSSKLGDAKCLGIRKRRLNRIVLQSYFRQFLERVFQQPRDITSTKGAIALFVAP
jgi:hypothetical protein